MANHVEIERKYDVDGAIAIEDLAGPDVTLDEPHTWRLVADYVDTPDLALARHGVTLRRREGGQDAGWHLKLPLVKGGRREVHAPLGAGARPVPAGLASLVAAFVRGRELVPVVTLETDRTARTLHDRDGVALAEVSDDVVEGRRLTGGLDRRPVSWREIEVELLDGPADVLDALEEKLCEAGAVTSTSPSKLARVLGDELAPASGRGGRSAGAALMAYMERQRGQVLAYDPLVQLADHDDDTVHKMRVAVRRIRSVLRTHARLLDGERVAELEAELKWLAGELGTVRDLEVLTARFDRHLAERRMESRAGRESLDRLAAEEREARRALKHTLRSPRYFAVLAALDDFIADPPFRGRAHRKATRVLPGLLAGSWRKVQSRYGRAERLPEGAERDRMLHSTRKAAKRARYTAEAAADILGKPATKLAKQAEKLQETLGSRQDALVAQDWLIRLGTRPGLSAEDAFTLGILLDAEREEATETTHDLAPVLDKATKRVRTLENR
ncbi:CYTH and CHAD domain-containing protein [Nonomuraea jabiensis]|uniref:CYTH and CHAD domain-containing protein n=1 Tax=Nonomuraea jabiensis TaxID=882448 RepID=UPI003449320B